MSAKKELKQLLGRLPDISMRGRKAYSAIELAYRIREACRCEKMRTSSEEMIQNILLVGKRLRYMSYEFTQEEYSSIVNEAFEAILLDYKNDEERRIIIQNLKDGFEETEEYISRWKTPLIPKEPSQEPLSRRKPKKSGGSG